MKNSSHPQPRFDTSTGQLISRCVRACGYHDGLIEENYAFAPNRRLPLVTFAHQPHDARSSCIVFLSQSRTPHEDVAAIRELGAPLIFFVATDAWEMWSLRSDGPHRERPLKASEVEIFFEHQKADFAPGAIFRAKTWARAETTRQIDFVDVGLLPLVEKEAGVKLRLLFENMVAHTMDALDMTSATISETNAHWLVKANFWLLAGKLLRDKSVPKFTRLDLNDVQDVFDRVAEHYGTHRVRANGRITALRGAAAITDQFASLRCISTETLGALYEEALLSARTRKLFSIHRTPTYLVDYMLAKLSRWIEEDIGISNCQVLEPACGHSPFLVGAVRMLSDLLPADIASNRTARRQFLRKHIHGCDRDAFALEIARLSLTLADIPNPNGWSLDLVKDMFDGDYLDEHIAKASVVLVNPPFERSVEASLPENDLRTQRNGQAAELLRRIVRSMPAHGVFGAVLPQTIMDSTRFSDLRQELLTKFELREISLFPDKMFQFADVETAVILGRRYPSLFHAVQGFKFRRVRELDMDEFARSYTASSEMVGNTSEIIRSEECKLRLPDLSEVWSYCAKLPQFNHCSTIGQGFSFKASKDPTYPPGETTVSIREASGFYRGFLRFSGSPDSHLLPELKWLNQKPSIIASSRTGTMRGTPQVITNYAPASRGVWRHKAFIDLVGRPATSRFLIFRPHLSRWSVQVLWAIWNSPLANAYTFAFTGKRDITATVVWAMPVPDLSKGSALRLEAAVHAYFAAARDFSDRQAVRKAKPTEPTKSERKKHLPSEDNQMLFESLDIDTPKAVATARERLRALQWRVDAEVLRLYALPPELERELLDFFDGVKRIGVPFEQEGYIPRDFTAVQRLDEFLRITDEWEQTDARRCELIEKRIQHGHRTPVENEEFKELQRLFYLHRCYHERSPLLDVAKLKQLQEEDSGWVQNE